jgi:hypothetical protein
MRRFLLATAAVSALALASPAAAQLEREFEVRSDAEFNARLDQRLDMIEDRLEAGIDAGTVNRTESRNIRSQLRTLARLQREYSANGFTNIERTELVRRLRTLRQETRMADGRGYDRNRRYGSADDWWDDDEAYQGRGGPFDADGDGWDDRDCDRDGDVDSGTCDTRREGFGGFIDTILGTGGLRVGQRVTGELYAVPGQYRNRYRDDSRYYYRSDGRRIYQIDARTDVVARVYPMP